VEPIRGIPGCPKCYGKGVILPDWNVRAVAIVCSCAGGSMLELKFKIDIDDNFKYLSMDKFMNYWHNVAIKDVSRKDILIELEEIQDMIPAFDPVRDIDKKFQYFKFLELCQNKNGAWDLDLLTEPDGFKNAKLWSQGKINNQDIFAVIGDVGKGKTSLLAGMLNDRCKAKEVSGKFVRCRALSNFIKSSMYSGAKSYQKYTDTMTEIISVPVLALDDIDCIDNDERVAKDMMMILSERKSLQRPTLLSSSKIIFFSLDIDSPLAKSNDISMFEAIKNSHKVVLDTWFSRNKILLGL